MKIYCLQVCVCVCVPWNLIWFCTRSLLKLWILISSSVEASAMMYKKIRNLMYDSSYAVPKFIHLFVLTVFFTGEFAFSVHTRMLRGLRNATCLCSRVSLQGKYDSLLRSGSADLHDAYWDCAYLCCRCVGVCVCVCPMCRPLWA